MVSSDNLLRDRPSFGGVWSYRTTVSSSETDIVAINPVASGKRTRYLHDHPDTIVAT